MIKKAKPFLRWAGGKSWLINQINEIIEIGSFNQYHEPFIGGGAMFFHLNPKNVSFLNDFNSELIDTYQCIKEDVNGVIDELKKFENTEECYYKIRAAKLNSPIERTARFIFLNQTSFNGIYRVNLKGEYDVPYGKSKGSFLNKENIIVAVQYFAN